MARDAKSNLSRFLEVLLCHIWLRRFFPSLKRFRLTSSQNWMYKILGYIHSKPSFIDCLWQQGNFPNAWTATFKTPTTFTLTTLQDQNFLWRCNELPFESSPTLIFTTPQKPFHQSQAVTTIWQHNCQNSNRDWTQIYSLAKNKEEFAKHTFLSNKNERFSEVDTTNMMGK